MNVGYKEWRKVSIFSAVSASMIVKFTSIADTLDVTLDSSLTTHRTRTVVYLHSKRYMQSYAVVA